MKRIKIIETRGQGELTEHRQRIAFHEAGHAAGICLNNKARQLPPVFFKIIFKGMGGVTETESMAYKVAHDECMAHVEGGRLIESLPSSIDNLVCELTEHDNSMKQLAEDYMVAFDADIINLLIGPLAEAKRVAEMDDELFNQKLVNLKALENYGGDSDLALVNEYLQSFSTDKRQQAEKLNELFNVAFDFINNDENWAAITKLAGYILGGDQNTIYCEEIASTLEQSVDGIPSNGAVAGGCHG